MICELDVGAVVYSIASPTLSSLFSMTLICFWTAMCCCWLMCTLAMVQREEEKEKSKGREDKTVRIVVILGFIKKAQGGKWVVKCSY